MTREEDREMGGGQAISGLVGSTKQGSTEQMLNNRLSEKRNQKFMVLKTKLSFSLIGLVNIPKIDSPLCGCMKRSLLDISGGRERGITPMEGGM